MANFFDFHANRSAFGLRQATLSVWSIGSKGVIAQLKNFLGYAKVYLSLWDKRLVGYVL